MADASGSAVRQISVLGDAPGGVAVRQAATVLINNAILQPRSADAVGDPQQFANASVTLEKRRSTGVASFGTLGEGAVTLLTRTAFGAGPQVPIIVLEQRTASGTNLNGSIAAGAVVLKQRLVSGIALSQGLSAGAVQFQPRTAAAVALNGRSAIGVVSTRRRQAQSTGVGGSVALGTAALQHRTVSGASATAALAAGAALRPYVFINGNGEAVIGEVYRTWAMNTQNEALTEYTNYNFNSYANFNGKLYAAGATGLFVVQGKLDNNAGVIWSLQTGFHDDNNPQLKRLHELVMSVRHDAAVRVRVWTDEITFYDYTLANFREQLQQVRVKTGKGLRSKFYRIELTSMGGTDFQIDSLNVPYVIVNRRIG